MHDKRYTEDPRVKGEIAEHLFIVECLKKGKDILKSLQQNPRYDFLIKLGNNWKKIQSQQGYSLLIKLHATKERDGHQR